MNLKTGVSRKQSTPNFPKNKHLVTPDTHTQACVPGGKNYLFFGKFGVLCFLETPVLRFVLLPYYRQMSAARAHSSKYGMYTGLYYSSYNLKMQYCVKSVQIESYFRSVFSCIRPRNNSVFGHFSHRIPVGGKKHVDIEFREQRNQCLFADAKFC